METYEKHEFPKGMLDKVTWVIVAPDGGLVTARRLVNGAESGDHIEAIDLNMIRIALTLKGLSPQLLSDPETWE